RTSVRGRKHMRGVVTTYLLTVFVSAALSAAVLVLKYERLPFFEAPDRFLYDLRYHFLAKQELEARPEFAIVSITQESLRGYPAVKPVDRVLLARLVAELQDSGARAIGLAFQFDRPTLPEKDDALARAIAASNLRIAVGVVDTRSELPDANLAFQAAFLAKARNPLTGHLYFDKADGRVGQQPDLAVRFMAPRITRPNETNISLAEALLDAGGIEVEDFWLKDNRNDEKAARHIAWLQPKARNQADTFTVLAVPPHDNPSAIEGPVLSPAQRAVLRDRFVIIGADVEPNDRKLTPFSVIGSKRMTNAEIHAQIAAQLKDKRSTIELTFEEEAGLAFVIATLAFAVGYTRSFQNRPTLKITGTLDYFVVALPIVAIGAGTFALASVVLPSDTMLYCVIFGVAVGHYLHNRFLPSGQNDNNTK
ncbi:MAG: CHASE2 domain-containing protein, partial [Pseudomonadota bacterium]